MKQQSYTMTEWIDAMSELIEKKAKLEIQAIKWDTMFRRFNQYEYLEKHMLFTQELTKVIKEISELQKAVVI